MKLNLDYYVSKFQVTTMIESSIISITLLQLSTSV